MASKQIEFCSRASEDLGIDFVAPYVLKLPDGHLLKAELLVKHFGAPNGMLIFNDSKEVMKYGDAIIDAGFGVSVMGDPSDRAEYSTQNYVELLSDWGWSGEPELKPSWTHS